MNDIWTIDYLPLLIIFENARIGFKRFRTGRNCFSFQKIKKCIKFQVFQLTGDSSLSTATSNLGQVMVIKATQIQNSESFKI